MDAYVFFALGDAVCEGYWLSVFIFCYGVVSCVGLSTLKTGKADDNAPLTLRTHRPGDYHERKTFCRHFLKYCFRPTLSAFDVLGFAASRCVSNLLHLWRTVSTETVCLCCDLFKSWLFPRPVELSRAQISRPCSSASSRRAKNFGHLHNYY